MMDSTQRPPDVSFIVPIYKVEQYLEQCINSLLVQTAFTYEVILVDDGSPDRCGEICDQYAAQFNHIHVIHRENGGLSVARNTGLPTATGEWVCFVDSDDWLEPNFSNVLAEYTKSSADVIIYGYNEVFPDKIVPCSFSNEVMHELSSDEVASLELASLDRFQLRKQSLNDFSLPGAWLKLYRTQFLKENELLFSPGHYFEDVMYSVRVFAAKPRVIAIAEPIYNYRKRKDSILHGYKADARDVMEPALLEAWEYVQQKHPGDAAYQRALYSRTLTTFIYYVALEFCSKSNSKTYLERKKDFLLRRDAEPYATAFKHGIGSAKNYPFERKLVVWAVRFKCFWLLTVASRLR